MLSRRSRLRLMLSLASQSRP
uniref:Uncharacterized protein n=1 Tax=Arundo donax TaxID=35708 RepID=A0A0A8YH09_ARUDO